MQPEAITRCTSTDEWKILKIDWQIPFHSLLSHGTVITDYWPLSAMLSVDLGLKTPWPDLGATLQWSPLLIVTWTLRLFVDSKNDSNYLSLAGHGYGGASCHNLGGEAVNREGQGGAPATPRIGKLQFYYKGLKFSYPKPFGFCVSRLFWLTIASCLCVFRF